MKTHKADFKKFKTLKEAKAFISGVQYGGDVSLEVLLVGKRLGGYMVRIDKPIKGDK